MDEYLAIRQRDNEFTTWRRRTNDGIPALASRIFALRERMYMGCGFHWSMEHTLGRILAMLNDFDNGGFYNTREAIALQIALQVATERLYASVAQAEANADEWARQHNAISTVDHMAAHKIERPNDAVS